MNYLGVIMVFGIPVAAYSIPQASVIQIGYEISPF